MDKVKQVSRPPCTVIHVQVTEEDIKRANEELVANVCSPIRYCCPISQALKRQFPEMVPFTLVTEFGFKGQSSLAYKLPTAASLFVMMFDCGLKVKPIEFDAVQADY